MKNQWLENESKRWVEEEIIDSQQRKAILSLYPTRNNTSIFFTFALILLSLALLTFLASNWTDIYPLIRTAILIGSLMLFYFLGTRWLEQGKRLIGEVSYLIALLLFGLSIFLIGDMYHYHFNSVFTFLVWSIVALLLYLSYSSRWIWAAGILIIVVGQMVDLFGLREFSWLLFAVFILGFGIIVYIRKIRWMAVVFSLAYFIQIIGLSTEKLSFVWVTVFLILLYFIGKMTQSNVAGKVFETFAPLFMFLFAVFHVLFVDMQLLSSFCCSFYLLRIFIDGRVQPAGSPTNEYWNSELFNQYICRLYESCLGLFKSVLILFNCRSHSSRDWLSIESTTKSIYRRRRGAQ